MGFAEKARPLYEGSRENRDWTWTEPMRRAFQELRQALLEAPALGLPDPAKPFQLFVDEKQGVGKGVLTQPGDLGGGLWHISLNDWTQWLRDGCPVSISLRLLLSLSMMLTS